jgi:hypothetical protein
MDPIRIARASQSGRISDSGKGLLQPIMLTPGAPLTGGDLTRGSTAKGDR